MPQCFHDGTTVLPRMTVPDRSATQIGAPLVCPWPQDGQQGHPVSTQRTITDMPILYTLNEMHLVPFLIGMIFRRPVLVQAVDPVIPGFSAPIRRLVSALESRGLIRRHSEVFPALSRYEDGYAEICFAHLYPRFEKTMAKYLRFDELDLGEYQQIYKHAAMTRMMQHLVKFSQLEPALPGLESVGARMLGASFDFCDVFALIYKHPLKIAVASARRTRHIANLLITLSVWVSASLLVLRSVRLRLKPRDGMPLGADLAEEGRVRSFFKQIAADPDEIAFVLRNLAVRDSLDPSQLSFYRHLALNDGQLTLRQATVALCKVITDLAKLYRSLSWLPPHIFTAVTKQVRKRVQFQAFFNRHQFQGFLARDEYNTDHITRSQELRRAGIRSMGLTHGMSTAPRIYPHLRYLDFDILYVFGKFQHESYGATWPADMTVRPVGCYSLDRNQMSRLGAPRTKDIVFFCNQVTDNLDFVRIVTEVLHALTDRKVFIKLKYDRDYIGADLYDRYMTAFGELPAHAVVVGGSPYELLMTAGYAISGLSTVVAEAVQLGLVSFFVDVYRPDQDVSFRAFPELCVTSAPALTTRIREIETGEWIYPRDRFADLIDLSGQNVFDTIRAELGLSDWAGKHHCR